MNIFQSLKDLKIGNFFKKKNKKNINVNFVSTELKKIYKNKNEELIRKFKKNGKGLMLANERSNLLDKIIFKCFKNFVSEENKINYAIVATGGYGRQELAPYSDIDLLFLHSIKNKNDLKKIVKPILYVLWNLGLKVGYATRTINECIVYSKKKLDICTSTLDSRFIVGNKNIFDNLIFNYKKKIISNYKKRFVKAIFKDRDKRLLEVGDTKFLLEPNVKNGKGVIRDLQILDWIGKFFYQIRNLNDLINYKILDKNSLKTFIKAKEFFWSVRSFLHIISKRPNEQLNFEYQNQIARNMGYKNTKALLAIENFMKDYFSIAKKVSNLLRIWCTLVENKEKLISIKKEKKIIIDEFVIKNKKINFFKNFSTKNYESFFRIIELAQKNNVDLHPEASKLFLDNLDEIKKEFKKKKYLFYFLRILTSKNNPKKFLELMNALGILGILIPDFKRITGQIQFGGFHTYTVDKHTLKAIGYINDFEKKNKENKFYNEIFSEIISPRILYISMFFHDLGKGTGYDHSIVSSKIAKDFCNLIKFEKIETDIVVWLIKNHLLMNKISQKRDLEDDKTIFEFFKKVKSLEQLKLLFLFTIADMKATGASIWNPWNKYPLEQLFLKTRKLFLNTSGEIKKKESNIIKINLINDKRLSFSRKNFFLNLFPDDFFLINDKKKIFKCLNILKKYKNTDFIHLEQDKEKLATEIIVYTKDRPGLLYKLSGSISLLGFNVIEAKVFTLKSGMVMDILYLRDINHGMLDKIYHFPKLESNLYSVINNQLSVDVKIKKEKKKYYRSNLFNINNKIFIDNNMSDQYTILEISSFDRVGLIYDLTKKLYELKLKIISAKILSLGYGTNDIFYIQDLKGNKIISKDKINKLKTSIKFLLKN